MTESIVVVQQSARLLGYMTLQTGGGTQHVRRVLSNLQVDLKKRHGTSYD